MKFHSARTFILIFNLAFLTASTQHIFEQPPVAAPNVVTGTDPEPQPDPPPPPKPKTSVAEPADTQDSDDAALMVLLGLD